MLRARGDSWQLGELDAELYPALSAAWQRACRPTAPLIGRDPGVKLRAMTVTPPTHAGEAWNLQAKALSPHPIRLRLYVELEGALVELGAANSELWNRNSHFARVECNAWITDGSLLVLRVEGAHQSFESALRVRMTP